MDEVITSCPNCHINVRDTDYFCFNCGKNLKPKPPSLSIIRLTLIMLGSILLPPMGVVWGWPYIKTVGAKYKILGLVIIGSTITSFVITTYLAVDFANNINLQVNEEMSRLQHF